MRVQPAVQLEGKHPITVSSARKYRRALNRSFHPNREVIMRCFAMFLAALFLTVGCGGGEPPAEEASAGPDSTALAQAAYDPTMFDTISWESQEEAVERGQVVYRFSCLKCHGERGVGDAGFVRDGDTLQPPSFREADWPYAGDKAGIHEQVFVGTAEFMPHWGLVGLSPRDVDAVAIYIMEELRNR